MKKVRDLIKELSNLDPEMPVYVRADHGQTFIQGGYVGVEYSDTLDYYIEDTIDKQDIEYYEDQDTYKICIISD